MYKKKRRQIIFIWLSVIVLCFPSLIFAETIHLKSGKAVEGKIVERTDKYIKIDFYGVELTYFLEDIADIDGKQIGYADNQGQDKQVKTQETNSSKLSEFFKDKDVYYVPEGYNIKMKLPKDWTMVNKSINSSFFEKFRSTIKDKFGTDLIVLFTKKTNAQEDPLIISLSVRKTRSDISITERLEFIIETITKDAESGKINIIHKPEILNNGRIIKYAEEFPPGSGEIRYQYIYQLGEDLFYILGDVSRGTVEEEYYKAIFDEIGSSIDSL
jgi:hypothetical protein